MKSHLNKLFSIVISGIATLILVSCGSHKASVVESTTEKAKSIEGESIIVETTELQGVEMVETLNDDGTKLIKMPYKWYGGIGKANDKQTAIEIAESEARFTISRVIENMVMATMERGSITDNGEVQKAITSHWKQVSMSIQNACEPMGKTKIEYNPTTKMYTATSKVGIRGDHFQQMLNSASNYKPANLSGDNLNQFVETNKTIIEAAKGN